ncbi:MAG: glycoside hydrolase family 3 C-terminal domain-containing protein [Saccharofermentans sp.]|nr:glycoside hydrolase family 3 C-terminal domain-containing protein [Saccharofermentans sp.]
MTKIILDWNEYKRTAIEAAKEGAVLIRNEGGALPLVKGSNIAVFGRMQSNYYKSGTGSGGMVNVDHVVDIFEALSEDPDIEIDEKIRDIYVEWEKDNPVDPGVGWGQERWSQDEMILNKEDVRGAASRCDTAVIIIARTAGEDRDNLAEKGSYYLTDGEEDMLSKVCGAFKKTVVLLNVGNIIDMSFIGKYSPSSVMYVWQAGMIGGTAAAELLTGKTAPSGSLTDTIAYNLSDHPSDDNFGNKDIDRDIYAEDIFVGYRYFSTFAPEKVMYPFGYGLSYTTFDIKTKSFEADGTNIRTRVIVTNTGDKEGKKTVMLFASAPKGKVSKSSMVLTDFKKTSNLLPGQSEELLLEARAEDYCSFDDDGRAGSGNAWILEKGVYTFLAGENVRDNSEAGSITLEEDILVERLASAVRPVTAFDRLTSDGSYEPVPLKDDENLKNRMQYVPEEIPQTGDKGIKLSDVRDGRYTMDEFIAQLEDEDLALIIRGEGMSSPRVTAGTASAFAGISKELTAMGIPSVCCDDGPSGMRLDSGKKAFALPNGTCLASSFNESLITKLFTYFAMEMRTNNVDNILGPGMNIHRHPLNGRNFEYFSEDPLVTGRIACAQLKGLHKHGVTATIKHFCCNNRETRRRFMDSVVSEKALREIYLKGFEIAVKKGGAKSIMSVYNRINGNYGSSYYDLHTTVLRRQWGFTGIVMTDWWAFIEEVKGEQFGAPITDHSLLARAQCDLFMVCAGTERKDLDAADTYANLKAGREDLITRAELQRNARNILTFAMNTPAMERLMGISPEIESIACPFVEEEADISADKYYTADVDPDIEIDSDTAKGEDIVFGITCEKTGIYTMEIEASSELDPVAQLPLTVFITGIPFNVITFNGTGGQDVIKTGEIGFLSKFAVIRIHPGKRGLKVKSIKLRFKEAIPAKH